MSRGEMEQRRLLAQMFDQAHAKQQQDRHHKQTETDEKYVDDRYLVANRYAGFGDFYRRCYGTA